MSHAHPSSKDVALSNSSISLKTQWWYIVSAVLRSIKDGSAISYIVGSVAVEPMIYVKPKFGIWGKRVVELLTLALVGIMLFIVVGTSGSSSIDTGFSFGGRLALFLLMAAGTVILISLAIHSFRKR